jgi:hypothetical protein
LSDKLDGPVKKNRRRRGSRAANPLPAPLPEHRYRINITAGALAVAAGVLALFTDCQGDVDLMKVYKATPVALKDGAAVLVAGAW